MKAGITTSCLFPLKETEQAITTLTELGAEYIDVRLNTFYEYRPEFARQVVSCARKPELYSVQVNALNFEPQLFSSSRRVRGDGFYWLEQVLRSCNLLGIKHYAFNGLVACERANDFDGWAAYIGRIIEFCSRYGMRFCLKNHCNGLFDRADIFKELKNRCPGLSGALDVKQIKLSGGSEKAYIKDMSGAISHVYISDSYGADKNDIKELLQMLRDDGFEGAVFMDIENWNGNIAELKRSFEYLREIISNI